MHSPSITAQPSQIVSATHHTTSNNSEAFSLLSRQSELHTTQHQATSTHSTMRMTTTNTFPTSNNMILGSTSNTNSTTMFLQSSSNVPYNTQQQSMITFNNSNNIRDNMVISSSPLSNPPNPFSSQSSNNQSSSSSSSSIQPLTNGQVNQNMYNNDQAPSFITSTVPMSTVMQPNNNTTSSSTSLATVNNDTNTNSSLRFVTVTNAAGRYEGEINSKNERHGKGTMYFAGGGFYKGYWVNDKMEGKGEYSWGDGNHYLGMFKDGKQNGVGVYEWPSGGKYIGHWKDDKMHGFGTYKRDDGIVYFGLWEDDHQSGMGLKVVPARFCHGDVKKSFNRRKFREIWKDKILIYQKEIIEMPNVLILQEKNRLTDISIVCQSNDEENCYQEDPIALQRFLRTSSSNLTLDFAKYFTISHNSDEENEPNRRKHYLEHDEQSPSESKQTKYSHNRE